MPADVRRVLDRIKNHAAELEQLEQTAAEYLELRRESRREELAEELPVALFVRVLA